MINTLFPNGRLRQEVEDKLQLCSASNRDKLQTATDFVTKKPWSSSFFLPQTRLTGPLGAVMWQRIQICCTLFALCSAAPPAHINRLALFPDKSAWCEAKNITQIVGHTGCQPRSIQNRSGWRPFFCCSVLRCLRRQRFLISGSEWMSIFYWCTKFQWESKLLDACDCETLIL